MNLGKLFDLSGKTALVTGGSRGLGLQIASALGSSGAQVVLSSRKKIELDAAVAMLNSQGIKASAIACDVSDPEQATSMVDQVVEENGGIDILVNNAGASWAAPAEEHPLAAWDKVMDLNIRAMFVVSQAVGKRAMIPHRYGRIINIASIAGLGGNPSGPMQTISYNTSKAAAINFTRTLAAEWGVHNITVNAIAPGFFPTKMTYGLLEKFGEEALAARTPLRRLGDETDLKGAVLLFASAAGKHITGQTLAVDGGASAVLNT